MSRRTSTRSSIAAALALAIAPAVAAAETHHVGAVTDSLYIGVAVAENPDAAGNRALAVYLCDDAGVFRWMFGIASSDAVAFQAEDMRVSLDLTGGAINGTVTGEGGETASFEVAAAAGEEAGIFRPRADYIGGWIVLNDGSQRGAVAFRERDQIMQPTLDPAAGAAIARGETITAERDLGLDDCFPEPSGRCPVR